MMKTCPFCAEEIQDAAVKCKHCGEMIASKVEPVGSQTARLPRRAIVLAAVALLIGISVLTLVGQSLAERKKYYAAAGVVLTALQRLESDVNLGITPEKRLLPQKQFRERLSEINASWSTFDSVYKNRRSETESFGRLSEAVGHYNNSEKLWTESIDTALRTDLTVSELIEASDMADSRFREELQKANEAVKQAREAIAAEN